MARHEQPRTGPVVTDDSGASTIDDGHKASKGERYGDADARDQFGGLNPGAAFFGWLVAVGVAILVTAIVAAILTAVGSQVGITKSDARGSAGSIGIAAGIVLLVILALAYYTGGYVAGRMSRYNGARQGFGVWLIGIILTIIAVILGAAFGDKYNVLDRANLPRLSISTDQAGYGGLITAAAVVVLTLITAVLGGLVGHRYHDKVDRAAHR